MSDVIEEVKVTDAIADRAKEWAGMALTKAKVAPIEDTTSFKAALPPYRNLYAFGESESRALDSLRINLENFALLSLINGKELPTWESKLLEVPAEIWPVLRVAVLKRLLKKRASMWGAERQLLPAGIMERIALDVDALITRHAMQMQGVSPPPKASN